MGTGYGPGGGRAAEVTSIAALLISFLFTLLSNALEPSKTPFNGP